MIEEVDCVRRTGRWTGSSTSPSAGWLPSSPKPMAGVVDSVVRRRQLLNLARQRGDLAGWALRGICRDAETRIAKLVEHGTVGGGRREARGGRPARGVGPSAHFAAGDAQTPRSRPGRGLKGSRQGAAPDAITPPGLTPTGRLGPDSDRTSGAAAVLVDDQGPLGITVNPAPCPPRPRMWPRAWGRVVGCGREGVVGWVPGVLLEGMACGRSIRPGRRRRSGFPPELAVGMSVAEQHDWIRDFLRARVVSRRFSAARRRGTKVPWPDWVSQPCVDGWRQTLRTARIASPAAAFGAGGSALVHRAAGVLRQRPQAQMAMAAELTARPKGQVLVDLGTRHRLRPDVDRRGAPTWSAWSRRRTGRSAPRSSGSSTAWPRTCGPGSPTTTASGSATGSPARTRFSAPHPAAGPGTVQLHRFRRSRRR